MLFAHHADYAAVTSGVAAAQPLRAFDRATHYLLDTRLMIAWSQSLAAHGQLDEARHLAARLREFGKEDAGDFFAPCAASAVSASNAASAASAAAFQCELPAHASGWHDFVAAGK